MEVQQKLILSMRHSAFESHNDLFNGDHAELLQFSRCRKQRNIGCHYSKNWCIKAIKPPALQS
jgi:hypothetical protein